MIKIDLDELTNGTVICIADDLGCEYEYPNSEDKGEFVIYMRKVKLWLEERYGMYKEWGTCMDVDKVIDKINECGSVPQLVKIDECKDKIM